MTFIAKALADISLGEPKTFENLTIFPLLAKAEGEPGYLTLDEAIGAGMAEVSEISEGGRVPELRFLNKGDKPILLVDGEELVGAKQNRILNLSILAPAGEEIVIPVSCVEAGRWNYRSRHFKSSNSMHFAKARASKAACVNYSMFQKKGRMSDQQEVWNQISAKEAALSMHLETSAMSDIYDRVAGELDRFVREFKPVANQVGAVFVLNGKPVGVDLFDNAATFGKLVAKLIRSYALDAIEPSKDGGRASGGISPEQVAAWLGQIDGDKFVRTKAVGLGEDIRISGDAYTAAALVNEEQPVHMCAFAN